MKNIFKSFVIMLITAFVLTACGGGSSSSGNSGGTPVFNGSGLLPNGVNASVNGDSYNCFLQYNSSCMNYTCDMNCYTTFQTDLAALGSNPDPADVAALEAAYETCREGCYAGCDMTSSFLITIVLTNTTTSTVTVTIPAGTTFVPSDSGYQPMMIIKEVTITITSQETKTLCLAVFCLDVSAHAPDEEADYTGYNIVLPTGTGCLPEIMAILGGVNFTLLNYVDYQNIQDVIWSCTSDGTIDTDELNFLNNLPKKSKMPNRAGSSLNRLQKKCTACNLKKLNLIK